MFIKDEIQHKGIFFGLTEESGKHFPVMFRKHARQIGINYTGQGFSRKSDAIGWGRKKINEMVK